MLEKAKVVKYVTSERKEQWDSFVQNSDIVPTRPL